MKAAQFHAQKNILVTSVPIPTPKPNEVLIKVSYCGICGSDIHEYSHGPFSCPLPSAPHPLTNASIPITLGHEFVGHITSAPAAFPALKPGTPVVVDPRIYCSTCTPCSAGHTHGCKALGFRGISTHGGFAEHVAVDASQCHPLPANVDLALAALIEPLAVAWHAVKTTNLPDADWSKTPVLILGGGPVGIAVAIVLRSLACKTIIVSEPSPVRAQQNVKVADLVLDPRACNVGERCREITGEGVGVVFDCAGSQPGFEAGMDALVYRGVYMNVAVWFSSPMTIPFTPFFTKEITLKTCLAYSDTDFKDVVAAFVAGRFDNLDTMVTSKIHIDDIVAKGFDELVGNKAQVKILVSCDEALVD